MRVLSDFAKVVITWRVGHFWNAVYAKMFSSVCTLDAYKLEGNAVYASVLLRLSKDGYFSADFLKISFGRTFALLHKMRVLGNLAKITITWPFGHCLKPLFAPKSLPVFAF